MTELNDFLKDEFSASERADIQQMADELILETGLQLLREELELSQKTVAEAMGVKQPRITQIEQGGADQRLITIKRYIEAMGGKLSLLIEMPDGSVGRTIRV
ncbi:helix-turn-helix transcriptional regulator [Pantoea sp. EA-12]|uniref:helix-turn-helix domain-containing protein n=1 Tax=Pantoea sp. EA-12 TaxID=3043303 RepID=UPI00073F7778|nr:helix-turn-helix transcriptional regulator [Pantoea sp. EA-12]MDI9223197.1 helix-turn-helix transcriptional regulator [Pantoea sp. EA-12]